MISWNTQTAITKSGYAFDAADNVITARESFHIFCFSVILVKYIGALDVASTACRYAFGGNKVGLASTMTTY